MVTSDFVYQFTAFYALFTDFPCTINFNSFNKIFLFLILQKITFTFNKLKVDTKITKV